MSEVEHIVNRRVNLLAEAIERQVDLIASFYAPANGQRALTEQQTTEQAWELWSAHRYDEIGKHLVSQMAPADVATLDAWLAAETTRRAPPTSQI